MELTNKQDKFAQGVASGMTGADAVRAAYSVEKWKPEAIHSRAYKLMQIGEVLARVEELRKPILEAVGLTLAVHLSRLDDLSRGAEKIESYGPAISAEVSRGRAAGLYVDRLEVNVNTKLADRLKDISERRKRRDTAS